MTEPQRLPQPPSEVPVGTKMWVWSQPGVGRQYEMTEAGWVLISGCFAPYIPMLKDDDGTLRL